MNTDNTYTVEELEAICRSARAGTLENNALSNQLDSGWIPANQTRLDFGILRYRPRPDPFEEWWSGLIVESGVSPNEFRFVGKYMVSEPDARVFWDSITAATKGKV